MSGAVKSIGKTFRKIMPNEVSKIAVKAAPFVAPFNPLLAGGMAALGSYDQTGSFGNALKAGLFTYGGGQLGRYIGGAGFQQGINPFAGYNPAASFGGLGSLFTSPIGTQTGLQLGQYKMFGGPGSEAFKAGQDIANIGQQTYTGGAINPNTGLPVGIEASEGAIKTGVGLPSNQFYPTDFSSQPLPIEYATDAATKAVTTGAKQVTPGYADLFKDILSGDLSKSTQAIKQLGGKALKDIYTNPVRNAAGEIVDTQIDKLAVGATIAGASSYIEAKKLAEEADLVDDADQYTEEMYEADKQRYKDYYSKILTPESFGIRTQQAQGGRVGFAFGSQPEGVLSITLSETGNRENFEKGSKYKGMKDSPIISINPLDDDLNKMGGLGDELEGPAGLGALGLMQLMKKGAPTFTSAEKTLVIKNLAGRSKGKPEYKELGVSIPEARKIMDNPDKYLKDATILKEFVNVLMGKKDGGRVGYKLGAMVRKVVGDLGENSPIQEVSALQGVNQNMGQNRNLDFFTKSGLLGIMIDKNKDGIDDRLQVARGGRIGYAMGSEVPIRQNQAGVNEMDFRNTGGFVPPIGVKEKADDIPAMLSNNEFVFTADAVRAAGGGSVNKGAQKMYALMKQLEGKMA